MALLPLKTEATHIVGGEMFYQCLGNDDYLVTLKLYRDCYNGVATYDDPTNIFIYEGNNTNYYTYLPVPFPGSDTLPNNANNPCLIVPPNICVEEAIFVYQVHLPLSALGYKMIYQRCCRNYSIVNIVDPSNTGGTYEATIPSVNIVTCNSSPYYINFPPTVICVDQPFTFDHSAIDPDGDSLVYSLCNPYYGATSLNPYPFPPDPYSFLTFLNPYTAIDPMGGAPPMAIDPETGLLTVTPTTIGQFVVGVCVKEYRNGLLLSEHKRDFQFNVTQCTLPAIAAIPSVLNGCDAFTFSFPNYSTGATTFLWDFGVPGLSSDTSTLYNPSYTYADTGVYTVTLYANPGTFCGDTATMQVYVYPTFSGGIHAVNGCQGVPLQFTDSTSSTYGYINSWYWIFASFGTSNLQNPTFTFDTTGTYLVTLVVGNTLGCVDTVTTFVTIHPQPVAGAYPDTTTCYLDTVQLFGSGEGNYLWTPDYSISNDTAQNPFVSPDVNTAYILTVENEWGCSDKDTVDITVINAINATAGPDTTLCPGEAVQLYSSGGWNFYWSPAYYLSNALTANPVATPSSSTLYTLTTSIGSCFDTALVYIGVKPLPLIIAGPDQQICIGDTVMIDACCGTSYEWEPSFSLSDPAIAAPLAFPTATTEYHLVASDTSSCPVTVLDTLIVKVVVPDPLITTPDTIMYLGTSAHLYCVGGQTYSWTPATYLDNDHIWNPEITPDQTITYIVYVTTSEGCKLIDTVTVTVVIDPLVIVPNAFTPNDDGLNDEFLPIVQGIFEAEIFDVFNRWGQLVYSTTDITKGWDGKHDGKESEMGTYVYYLKGKSGTTAKEYFVKGNVVLLR